MTADLKKTPFVDENLCIGCTLCTQICPNVYGLTEEAKAKIMDSAGDSEEKIQESIDACPVKCIFWR